jgi:hypothetical protein
VWLRSGRNLQPWAMMKLLKLRASDDRTCAHAHRSFERRTNKRNIVEPATSVLCSQFAMTNRCQVSVVHRGDTKDSQSCCALCSPHQRLPQTAKPVSGTCTLQASSTQYLSYSSCAPCQLAPRCRRAPLSRPTFGTPNLKAQPWKTLNLSSSSK